MDESSSQLSLCSSEINDQCKPMQVSSVGLLGKVPKKKPSCQKKRVLIAVDLSDSSSSVESDTNYDEVKQVTFSFKKLKS